MSRTEKTNFLAPPAEAKAALYFLERKSPILSFLPVPTLQHPELLQPENQKLQIQSKRAESDKITCAERIRLGEQSLNINQHVAVEMSEILTELLLTHKLKRFAAYFDLESGASRAIYNTPEAIKTACLKMVK